MGKLQPKGYLIGVIGLPTTAAKGVVWMAAASKVHGGSTGQSFHAAAWTLAKFLTARGKPKPKTKATCAYDQ